MFEAAWKAISTARSVAVLSHLYPDGDTLGAMLGLVAVLKKMGVKASAVNATETLPRTFAFLPGFARIRQTIPESAEVVVAVDMSTTKLAGVALEGRTVVNIDHHLSNENFGTFNLVFPELASSGEAVWKMLEENRVELDADAALCLYASIASDTRFFTTQRTSGETFRIASALVEKGVDPSHVARNLRSRPLSSLRLEGEVMQALELHHDGTTAAVLVTEEMLARTSGTAYDLKEIVGNMLDLVTADLSLLVAELPGGKVKISVRSETGPDATRVTAPFQGGGHKQASGALVRGRDAREVYQQLMTIIEKEKELV